MKKLFIFSVLVVVFVGFSTCSSSKESSDTGIKSFKVDGVEWRPGGGVDFTNAYSKGTTIGNLNPSIELSHPKASYEPKGAVDFSGEKTVTFKVTAENGDIKNYTAKATVLLQ